MKFDRYVRQVRALVEYRGIRQIPADPYDIPVDQVRQLVTYAGGIKLTALPASDLSTSDPNRIRAWRMLLPLLALDRF